MDNTNLISNLLGERSNFILIGLTGRTGSGCTTTANLLSGGQLQFPTVSEVNYKTQPYFTGMDSKRYEIVRKYAIENNDPFKVIKISELISAQILSLDITVFKTFIESVIVPDLHHKLLLIYMSLYKILYYFIDFIVPHVVLLAQGENHPMRAP